MTPKETASLLKAIRAMYANFDATAESVPVWAEYLEDYPADVMRVALKAYIDQGNAFPPNAGQLVALTREATAPQADAELEAATMWDKALTFLRDHPPHQEPAMDEKYPDLGRVVAMVGGWTAMRSMASEDIHRNTKPHFLRLYAALVKERRRIARIGEFRERLGMPQLRALEGGAR